MPDGKQESEWIVKMFDQRIRDLEVLIGARFDAAQSAVDKAERSMNSRLEGMNEFRDTLKDQASKFITEERLKPIESAVDKLRISEATLAGKASQTALLFTLFVSVVGLVIGIIEFFSK